MNQLTDTQLKGQHGTCPTVKVKADNDEGYTEINAHDFDKDKHELFEGAAGKDWSKATKADIIKELDRLEIAHDPKSTKDQLIELIPA